MYYDNKKFMYNFGDIPECININYLIYTIKNFILIY